MATEPSTHETTFDFDGIELNITATFWWNEVSMQVNEIDRIVLTDTDQSLNGLLSNEEIVAHLSERIEREGEELRKESAGKRLISDHEER